MRRRAVPDQRQVPLFKNEEKPAWPVVHPGALLQPTSDETGGPLSAVEAERVTRGASIRFAGHVYDKGLVLCRECGQAAYFVPGNGFRMTVYSGTTRDRFVGKCGRCGVAVVGEDPRAASPPR
jgi:hypothetical protein